MFRIEQRGGHICTQAILYSGNPALSQSCTQPILYSANPVLSQSCTQAGGPRLRRVYQSALLPESDEEVPSDDDPAESFLAWLFSVFSEPLSEPLSEDVLA
jgi:hypothetical protein